MKHTRLKMKMALVLFALSTSLAAIAATPGLEDHVRIEYRGLSTPDHLIFRALLGRVLRASETQTQEDFEDWIFTEMNMTYSEEQQAWTNPQVATLKHTRAEIREFAAFLVDVAEQSEKAKIGKQRQLFCAGDAVTLQQKIAALELRDELERVDGEFYLNYVYEEVGESLGGDVRAWINRNKQGYSQRKYDYRTLWADKNEELGVEFANFCNETGGQK